MVLIISLQPFLIYRDWSNTFRRLLYGVSQGSVLGSILFPLYTAPLSKVICRHPFIQFHFYADNTQLFTNLTHKNVTRTFEILNKCLEDVKMVSAINLELNIDKTEFIMFGPVLHHNKLKSFLPVSIFSNQLSPAKGVKSWFDSTPIFLSMFKVSIRPLLRQNLIQEML